MALSASNIRVLHVLGTAAPAGSGIARTAALLAKGLRPYGIQTIACFLGGDGPLSRELEQSGVEVKTMLWEAGARDPLGALQFLRFVRHSHYSLVHLHFGGRAPRWIACRRRSIACVRHLWGHIEEQHNLRPITYRASPGETVIATSRAVAATVRGCEGEVVYPGIEIEKYCIPKQREGSVCTIGTAGRLVPMKGIVYLLRALPLLLQEFPEVQLAVAGEGPLRAALEGESKALGVEAAVRFLGWRPNLAEILPQWDVFVQPSLCEPFGITAVEAMASGLPVVATKGAGLEEVVEENRTGLLVEPGDPSALAAQIRMLLRDRSRARHMGLAGRRRAEEHFSAKRMTENVFKVYHRVLS